MGGVGAAAAITLSVVTDAAERLSTDDFARWWKEAGERELRQLMYWEWAPIGVHDSFPYAVDEYDGYARQVMQAIRRGATEGEIAAMLEMIERDDVGLGGASSNRAESVVMRFFIGTSSRRNAGLSLGHFAVDALRLD